MSEHIHLDTFVLAGGQYYELKKVIDQIRMGDLLYFVVDDENEHDEYAVQVFWNKYMLGYLSRSRNRIICNMLINDLELYGLVTKVDKQFSTQLEFDIVLNYL